MSHIWVGISPPRACRLPSRHPVQRFSLSSRSSVRGVAGSDVNGELDRSTSTVRLLINDRDGSRVHSTLSTRAGDLPQNRIRRERRSERSFISPLTDDLDWRRRQCQAHLPFRRGQSDRSGSAPSTVRPRHPTWCCQRCPFAHRSFNAISPKRNVKPTRSAPFDHTVGNLGQCSDRMQAEVDAGPVADSI